MPRFTLLWAALTVVVVLAGCDSKPPLPATDPESIKQLEKLQQEGSDAEKGKKSDKQ